MIIFFQPKEKDLKGKTGHKFVSASVSNSMLCDVCRKSLANKPALRCESEYTDNTGNQIYLNPYPAE